MKLKIAVHYDTCCLNVSVVSGTDRKNVPKFRRSCLRDTLVFSFSFTALASISNTCMVVVNL